MVRFAKITVVLLDGTTVVYQNQTLLEVVKDCLSYPMVNQNPLLIQIANNYNLYCNSTILKNWVEKQISINEVLEDLKVDRLMRNKDSISVNGVSIDADSLWLVKNNLCILANTDTFVSERLDNRFKLFN